MHLIKQLWVRAMRRARDEYEETQDDLVRSSPRARVILYSVASYFVITFGVGLYWSLVPAPLSVSSSIQSQLAVNNLPSNSTIPNGFATVSTLIQVSKTLLQKPGGYLANDLLPPGVWLDDMPHWELGVLSQVRDTTRILRESFCRPDATQMSDADLQKAEVRFHFSDHSWIFPATESQYLAGIEHLEKYNQRLLQSENSDAHFYADAQHLSDYLAGVEMRLKNLSQRLTASVGPSVNTDAAAMSAELPEDSSVVANGLYTKTPWSQLDDIFYEAKGSSWAMITLLQSIEMDFSMVLQEKNAKLHFEQIIRELKPTQQKIYSPIILNGEGFGFVANHSLVMASYLARAQAAVADCRRQLLVPAF